MIQFLGSAGCFVLLLLAIGIPVLLRSFEVYRRFFPKTDLFGNDGSILHFFGPWRKTLLEATL
jgi:hypothetical protein